MWQITNKTPFPAQLAFCTDPHGVDTAIAVVKATFAMRPNIIALAQPQLPIVTADAYWADPATSSIRYASEIGFVKPSTDIVMLGHCWAPGGKPVRKSHVRLTVGPYSKTVKVFGNRYADTLLGIRTIVGPLPFEKIALKYENAYGGTDIHKSNPEIVKNDPCNPVGKGFRMRGGSKPVQGSQLPNLQGGNPPEGFGYIAPAWQPRAKYAGTYDAQWQKNRAPRLPEDFSRRFFNCAHPDLITNGYLKGGQSVVIENASPNGILRFALPTLAFKVCFVLNGQKQERPSFLDTLIIEPDENRFSMIWRASRPCDKAMLQLNTVRITCIYSDINLEKRSDA